MGGLVERRHEQDAREENNMANLDRESYRFTRRQMMRLGLLAAGTALLGACAPAGKSTEGQQTGAGEGAPAASKGPVNLTMMGWGGPQAWDQRDAAVRKAFPELNDRVKAVEFISCDGSNGVLQQLRLRFASGQDIPDAATVNYEEFPELAVSGELTDLTELFSRYKSDLYDGAVQLPFYGGKYLAFASRLKSKMFYWRSDLFEQASFKAGDIVTVADLLNVGKAFHAKFPESYLLNMGPQPTTELVWEVLSAYPDARFADPGGKWRLTQDQAFADTFKFFKDVYDAKICLPIEDWSTDWEKGFADSAICGTLSAQWMKDFLPQFAPKQAGMWGYGLWPLLEPLSDQRFGSDTGGSLVIVLKRSAHPDVATDYMTKMWLEKKGSLAVYEDTGLTPLVKSVRDEYLNLARNQKRPEGMSDEKWNAMPAVYFGAEVYEVELESFKYLRAFAMDPSAAKEKKILDQWLNKYLTDQASLSEALQGAEKDMQSQIGDPYKV